MDLQEAVLTDNIDTILEELLLLEADIKPKIKRIDEIKTWCKSYGTFSTVNYTCTIKDQERTCMVGMEKCIDALGRTVLDSMGLIQLIQFKTVHIGIKLLK